MSMQPVETKQIKIDTIKLPSLFLAFLIYGRIKEIPLNVSFNFSLCCDFAYCFRFLVVFKIS